MGKIRYIFGNEEIYRVHSESDNTVLIMNIDYNTINKVYKGAKFLEFDIPEDTKSDIERGGLVEFKDRTLNLAESIINAKPEDDFQKKNEEFIEWMIRKFEIVGRKLERINQQDLYYERLLKTTDFIQENFNNRDVLKRLAEAQFLNPAYISHVLKAKVDYNYRQLINFYRVGYAIKLLLGTSYTIADISAECGFSATRYFYKKFKKFYAEGPTNFRKQYRNVAMTFYPKSMLEEIETFRAYKRGEIVQKNYKLQAYSQDEDKLKLNEDQLKQEGQKWNVVDETGEIVGIAYVKKHK